MKSQNKLWLDIAEYAFLATSIVGIVVAIMSGIIAYAATPLTLALCLNTLNRHRFQQQTCIHTKKAIAEMHQAIGSLHQQVDTLPSQRVDLNPITHSLQQVEQEIQRLTLQFNTQPETQQTALENQLNALALRVDSLSKPSESIDLRVIEANIVSLQAQLQNVDPSSLNRSIDHLQDHINRLNQQIENLPAPFDPSELEQRLTELKDSHSLYGEHINQLVLATVNLRAETVITEQARASQLDALMLQLETLSNPQQPSDIDEDAIAQPIIDLSVKELRVTS